MAMVNESEPVDEVILHDEELQEENGNDEIVLYRPMPRKCNIVLGVCVFVVVLVGVVVGLTVSTSRNSSSSSSSSPTQRGPDLFEPSHPSDPASQDVSDSDTADTVDPQDFWSLLGEPLNDNSWQDISLALSNDGRVIAVGNADLPEVQMFEFVENEERWISRGSIAGSDDSFGVNLGLSKDGRTVAIGGHLLTTGGANGTHVGHVQVWHWNPNLTKYEKLGEDVLGEAEGDQAGSSVALNTDGTILAVSAHMNSGAAQRAGHVRVYRLVDGDWEQMGGDLDGQDEGDQFGWSMDLSEDGLTVAIGGRFYDIGEQNEGHVRVYQYNGADWVSLGDSLEGVEQDEEFGYSLALSGDGKTVAVGNSLNQVAVYYLEDGTWTPLSRYLDLAGDDVFLLVSLSYDGLTLAVLEKPRHDTLRKVTVLHYVDGKWAESGQSFTGDALALSGNGKVLAIGGIEESNPSSETVRILTEAHTDGA